MLDSFGPVVVALVKLAAAVGADRFVFGCAIRKGLGVLTFPAGVTAGQPFDEFLGIHVDQNNLVQLPGLLRQDFFQRLGLVGVPRKTVQEEAFFLRHGQEPVQNNADGHVIGHEQALLDITGYLLPQIGIVPQVVAEEVPGADMLHGQLFLEKLGLRTFAGAGRAEEDESEGRSHGVYLKKPS